MPTNTITNSNTSTYVPIFYKICALFNAFIYSQWSVLSYPVSMLNENCIIIIILFNIITARFVL